MRFTRHLFCILISFLCIFGSLSSTSWGYTWSSETIAPSHDFSFFKQAGNIALDTAGRPHIVYGGKGLFHSWHNGVDWQTETVKSGISVSSASLAIDALGKLHIVCYSNGVGNLSYLSNSTGTWTQTDLDTTTRVTSGHSIAVDSTGKAHVAYIRYNESYNASELQYVTNASGSWLPTLIAAPPGFFVDSPSIAVDSDDAAHISFYSSENTALLYATNSDGPWSVEVVDSALVTGKFSSIALDSGKNVHISYWESQNKDLRYANNIGGSWSSATVATGRNINGRTSIIVGSDDFAHIISVHQVSSGPGNYYHASNSSGSWTEELIASNGGGWDTSAVIDGSNKIHLSNMKSATSIEYLTNASGSWVTTPVDTSWTPGGYFLSIDGSDNLHLIHSRANSFYYSNNTGGSWSTGEAVQIPADRQINAFARSADGSLHFFSTLPDQFDPSKKTLYYTTRISGIWNTTEVTTAGFVSSISSIVFDQNGTLHISYYPASTIGSGKVLKHLYGTHDTWTSENIDTNGGNGWVGDYSSLAIDASGKLHVSYYDEAEQDLKYATNSSGSWVPATLDSLGSVGKSSTIAIDKTGKVHITYIDEANSTVMHITNSSGSWVKQSLQDFPNGTYLSPTQITIDSKNKVHVFFGTYEATNASGSWVTAPYFSTGARVVQSSTDTLHLIYTDSASQNLTHTWSLPDPINGVCGTSHGSTLIAAPTTNLCQDASTPPVTGNGPWNWTCAGQFGGSSASCSANIQTYTVTFQSSIGGSVAPSGSQSINHGGSSSAVTATPSSAYDFVNWTGSGGFVTTAANPLTVSDVTAAMTITANFAIKTFTISGSAAGGNGTVSCPPSASYGSSPSCIITPAPGYALTALTDNSVDVLSAIPDYAGGSYLINAIAANHDVVATFSPISYGSMKLTDNTTDDSASDSTVDGNGNLHVVYVRDGSIRYRFHNRQTASWNSEETVSAGSAPAVAAGPNGVAQVVYLSGSSVGYRARTGGVWSDETTLLASGANHADLDVAADNSAHVAIGANVDGDIYGEILYTNNTSGTFTAPAVQPLANGIEAPNIYAENYQKPSIKVDASGNYHIVCLYEYIDLMLGVDYSYQSAYYFSNAPNAAAAYSSPLPFSGNLSFSRNPFAIASPSAVYATFWSGTDIYIGKISPISGSWEDAIIAGSQPSITSDTLGNLRLAYLALSGNANSAVISNGTAGSIIPLAPAGAQYPVAHTSYGHTTFESSASGNGELYAGNINQHPVFTALPDNFGTVQIGQSSSQELTVRNIGNRPLTLTSATLQTGTSFAISAETCTQNPVASSATCTVTLSFSPVSGGSLQDILLLASDEPQNGSITVTLAGTGVNPPVNAFCGTPHGGTFITAPTTDLCSAGTPSAVTGSGPWNWNCQGQYGGSNASCSAGILQYNVTFSAGQGGSVSPEGALAVNYGGTSTPVTATPNSGYRFVNWTGSSNFVSTENPLSFGPVTFTASVTANFELIPVDGVCGPSHGGSFTTAPDTGLCAAGIPGVVFGSGPWDWQCGGRFGGADVNCSTAPITYGSLRLTSNGTDDSSSDSAVDPFGNLHVVYQRDGYVYYRYHDRVGAYWLPEESLGTGGTPAVAVGPNGQAQVVFISAGAVKYRSRSFGSWNGEIIIHPSGATHADLDVDNLNNAHIALSADADADTYQEILYTTNKTGSFPAAAILGAADGFHDDLNSFSMSYDDPAIKVDQDGNYHIACRLDYQDDLAGPPGSSRNFFYFSNRGAMQVSSSPTMHPWATMPEMGRSSLALRNDGVIFVTYWANGTIYIGGIDPLSGVWTEETLSGTEVSVTTDSQGAVRLAWVTQSGNAVMADIVNNFIATTSPLAPNGSRNPVAHAAFGHTVYENNTSGNWELYAGNLNQHPVISPAPYDFGMVATGQSVNQVFSITNNGNRPLTISSVSLQTGTDFTISSESCTAGAIAANASCTVTVTFSPQTAAALSDTLRLLTDEPGNGEILSSISGSGAIIDGVCGASSGGTFAIPPTMELCNSGIPSGVAISNGLWSWTCSSPNGGSNATCTANLLQHILTVTIAGTGGTAITSSSHPGTIVCLASDPGKNCSAAFDPGTVVTLTAASTGTSEVTGWSGADTTFGNPVNVTLDADKTVTASFNTIQQPVLIYGKIGYDFLGMALLTYQNADTIMLKSSYSPTPENVLFSQPYSVDLLGGFDNSWTQQPGSFSKIKGSVKVKSGKVTAKGIKIGN